MVSASFSSLFCCSLCSFCLLAPLLPSVPVALGIVITRQNKTKQNREEPPEAQPCFPGRGGTAALRENEGMARKKTQQPSFPGRRGRCDYKRAVRVCTYAASPCLFLCSSCLVSLLSSPLFCPRCVPKVPKIRVSGCPKFLLLSVDRAQGSIAALIRRRERQSPQERRRSMALRTRV